MNQIDISWLDLFLGSLIILIPVIIFVYFKTGLIKSMAIAMVRMAVQLYLVGLYLQFIFDLNSPAVNLLWLVIMAVAAVQVMISRSSLNWRFFLIPLIAAVAANILLNGSALLLFILGSENITNARYLIPIMGMVIGNTVTSSIIGIRTFYQNLANDTDTYKYKLVISGSKNKSLFDYTKKSLQEAFNPIIASTATIGLIWLPGMMTGQILGGSDPMLAIKYQILIVVGIFSGGVLTVFTTIIISKYFVFDKFDLLKSNALTKK